MAICETAHRIILCAPPTAAARLCGPPLPECAHHYCVAGRRLGVTAAGAIRATMLSARQVESGLGLNLPHVCTPYSRPLGTTPHPCQQSNSCKARSGPTGLVL